MTQKTDHDAESPWAFESTSTGHVDRDVCTSTGHVDRVNAD